MVELLNGKGGIENYGEKNIIINGGKIIATGVHGIRNSKGTVKFYDGEINANGDGIWMLDGSGNLFVTGGKITGGTNGIAAGDSSNIIIGVNDGIVQKDSPIIISTRGCGINKSKGVFCFYDGKIESAGKLIYGLTPEIPEGYKLIQGEKEIIDGVEYLTSYLEKQ